MFVQKTILFPMLGLSLITLLSQRQQATAEAALAPTEPAPVTAILAGKNSGTGVGLVEVYNIQ